MVEGSALRVGDRVRITVQLVDALADRSVWAKSYDRDLTDILALQSEVASAIAEEIRSSDPGRAGPPAAAGPVNPARTSPTCGDATCGTGSPANR